MSGRSEKERTWQEPSTDKVYSQHWVRGLRGEKLDKYTLKPHSLQLWIKKWIGYKDKAIDISYDRIDSVEYEGSLFGWLFGYGTVIVDVGDDKYRLVDVSAYKKLYNELSDRINKVKNHKSY